MRAIDVMVREVVTVTGASALAADFAKSHGKSARASNVSRWVKNGKLVGIVSRANLVQSRTFVVFLSVRTGKASTHCCGREHSRCSAGRRPHAARRHYPVGVARRIV